MAIHVRYCLQTAHDCGVTAHPMKQLHALGISYQIAVPQTIGDQWWLFGCSGMPKDPPRYLTPLDINPHDYIGYGLSKDDADRIAAMK